MTKLHPDLLRACAAYLAHADAYCLDSDDQMALLRETGRPFADAEEFEGRNPENALIVPPPTDRACDEFTHAHIEAIRRARSAYERCDRGAIKAVAHAILDATPAMLAWWCERLGGE